MREARLRPQPGTAALWILGYWHWTGLQYTWIPGHWVVPPAGTQRWRAPVFPSTRGTYFYEPGGSTGRGNPRCVACARFSGLLSRRWRPRHRRPPGRPGRARASRQSCTSPSRPIRRKIWRFTAWPWIDLPAALQTPSGSSTAPNPGSRPRKRLSPSGAAGRKHSPIATRIAPSVSDYDNPFTPSTAPFKRLEAFDAVLERLPRRGARRRARGGSRPLQGGAPPTADEDAFFADLVVDAPGRGRARRVRIPSVGAGRAVSCTRGSASAETPAIALRIILRDGADNWFLQPAAASGGPRALGANGLPKRARLVMEVAIARAAFGGAPGDVGWSELPFVPPLPDNVARDAALVRGAIGVSRAMLASRRHREARRLLPGLRRFGGAAVAARERVPRPGPVQEGRLQAPRLRVSHHGAERRHPDAARPERGARLGRDPRRDPLEAHRPRRGRPHGGGFLGCLRYHAWPPPDTLAWPQSAQRRGEHARQRAIAPGGRRRLLGRP